MKDVTNSWKNEKVFAKQLELNKDQLTGRYPGHWYEFLNVLKDISPTSIIDIGCGCGAYYELCKKHHPDVFYTGIDYSKEAIDLAIKTWDHESFFVKDYKSLTKHYLSNYQLIHMGALLDVLPDGDEALDFILSLKPKMVLIGRMKMTDSPSGSYVYRAYDEIETYSYSHNVTSVSKICDKNGYRATKLRDHYLLVRGI